jgi:hypothetical protein
LTARFVTCNEMAMALAAAPAGLERPIRTRRFSRSQLTEVPNLEAVAPQSIASEALPLSLGVHLSLPEVAERIERAAGDVLSIDEVELAPVLKAWTALRTLRRRADKRQKHLVLRASSRGLCRLAEAAGWETKLERSATVVALPFGGSTQTSAVSDQRTAMRAQDAGRALFTARGGDAAGRVARMGTLLQWLFGATARGRARELEGVMAVRVPRGDVSGVPALERPRVRGRARTSAAMALPVGSVFGVIFLLVAWTVVPAATVQVVPVAEPWNAEFSLVVDPSVKKADVARGRMPGRVVTKEVAESATAPATGKRIVPEARATGEVVLLNRSDTPVTVPKGTIVLAGNVRFTTQTDVTVAASRAAGAAQSFGMSTVKITASNGGLTGNVERNQISRIEGPLSSSLSVQNNAPTRGGTERAITFVTEDDRKKLHDKLLRDLSERLNQQLKGQLPVSEKESAVPWSGQNPAVTEAVFNRNVDEEAQNVTLTMKLRYAVTVFENDAYNNMVQQLAATKPMDGHLGLEQGMELVKGSLQAQPPEIVGVDNGIVRLTARARGTMTAGVDRPKLQRALANQPLAQAHTYLGSLSGASSYELHPTRTWFGRMPWLGWRIQVVKGGSPLAGPS